MPEPFGPTSPTFSPRSTTSRRSVEQLLVSCRQHHVVRLEDDPAGAWRVEKVEAERALPLGQRLDLAASFGALLLEPCDLRELRLRLLRLALLVPEPLHEPLEPRDVDRDAVGGLAGRGCARGLLLAPLVPRPGEVVGASGRELEHRGRDGLEEPAVVRDEDDGGVDRLELALEPLEVLHVEVVRRLVEQEEIRASGERARERGARQLAARERPERPVEVLVGEAEPAHRSGGSVAPRPAAGVLEP